VRARRTTETAAVSAMLKCASMMKRTIKPTAYPVPTDGPVGRILDRMGRHPMRPAHLHFIVTAPGYETVVTHLFVEGDPYLESDVVFGVKNSLVIEFKRNDSEVAAKKVGLSAPFYAAGYDFVLRPAVAASQQKAASGSGNQATLSHHQQQTSGTSRIFRRPCEARHILDWPARPEFSPYYPRPERPRALAGPHQNLSPFL